MYRILRDTLRVGIITEEPPGSDPSLRVQAQRLERAALARFGHSLAIRHVDAGSCNGCELEIQALNNPYYMLEGLGFRFVASPRHADVLLVTGPVSRHMETALKRTYAAMPEPKLVVAVGDCGRDGGIFGCSYASLGGVSAVIPVDVVVPGCPPSPMILLQGLITAVTADQEALHVQEEQEARVAQPATGPCERKAVGAHDPPRLPGNVDETGGPAHPQRGLR